MTGRLVVSLAAAKALGDWIAKGCSVSKAKPSARRRDGTAKKKTWSEKQACGHGHAAPAARVKPPALGARHDLTYREGHTL